MSHIAWMDFTWPAKTTENCLSSNFNKIAHKTPYITIILSSMIHNNSFILDLLSSSHNNSFFLGSSVLSSRHFRWTRRTSAGCDHSTRISSPFLQGISLYYKFTSLIIFRDQLKSRLNELVPKTAALRSIQCIYEG